jgi:hypothetical protein
MKKALLVAAAVAGALFVAIMTLRRRQAVAPAPTDGIAVEPSFDGMTRDELYELARERDIPGRSRMKKDELRDALRRA